MTYLLIGTIVFLCGVISIQVYSLLTGKDILKQLAESVF